MTFQQRDRSVQEYFTSLSPAEALDAAKTFFARRNSIYSAFLEQESARHITLRGQGGEEIAIAATPDAPGTRVSASTYLFDQQVARFFATLPPASPRTDDPADASNAPVAHQVAHP